MYDLTPRRLKTAASERLSQASYSPGKLALLHSLVLVGMLALDLVSYVLDLQIDKTGGLSGMGTRTVLTTIQTVLNLGYSLALPFWQIAFALCALNLARRKPTTPQDFPEGFRRFGPVLRLFVVEALIYFFVIMVAVQVASIIFLMTPYSDKMVAVMEPLLQTMESGGVIDDAAMEAILPTMVPLYVILVSVLAAVCIPVFYRLRFIRFAIMDEHRMGALAAVRLSWGMSRGNRLKLFKLDLSFWWYYLLQAAALVLTDGAYYLQLLEVTLPLPQIVTTLVLRSAGIGASLLIAWRYKSYREATYATAYDSILTPITEQ